MMGVLVILPLLIPLFAAIFCLLSWKNINGQRMIVLAGSFLLLVGSAFLLREVWLHGIQVMQIGNWPAPFGITLVADLLSAGLLLTTSLLGIFVFIFSIPNINLERKEYGFYPILMFLLFGISGALLAGDIFNLYVWFEVMLMSSFVLLSLGGTKNQLEGSVKYLVINFLASSIFLAGIGVIYGLTGSLNMAQISLLLPEIADKGLVTLAAIFFLVGFGIKAGLFPLFFWLPAAYHTPPSAITAIIGGLLTKVGVYVLVRFFTLIFFSEVPYLQPYLFVIAGLTMFVGVFGAIAQNDFRKILSFSIISQIGYMIMGLAIHTPLAIAAVVYFIIHNMLVKTNLFLISGVVYAAAGSFKLKKLGSIYAKFPFIAFLFIISAFSLTGVPPLSGFWAKFLLIKAAVASNYFIIVGVALVVSALSIIYITKIWNEVFWKKAPDGEGSEKIFYNQTSFLRLNRLLILPVVLLTIIIVAMGFYAEPFLDFSVQAAEQLFNRDNYIKVILRK